MLSDVHHLYNIDVGFAYTYRSSGNRTVHICWDFDLPSAENPSFIVIILSVKFSSSRIFHILDTSSILLPLSSVRIPAWAILGSASLLAFAIASVLADCFLRETFCQDIGIVSLVDVGRQTDTGAIKWLKSRTRDMGTKKQRTCASIALFRCQFRYSGKPPPRLMEQDLRLFLPSQQWCFR